MNNILRKAIDVSTAGATVLVGGSQGYPCRVAGLFLLADGDVNVTLRAGGTDLTGPVPLSAFSGFVLPVQAAPGGHWLEAPAGADLEIALDAAVQVSGALVYGIG